VQFAVGISNCPACGVDDARGNVEALLAMKDSLALKISWD
jgi:hypothetical protein